MNLDIIAGVLVGLMACCAFTLDIMTSPKESRWWALPKLIRWEIRATAVVLMVRSVNLMGMAKASTPVIGQANGLAALASACLAITVISLTIYALQSRLPGAAWDRVSYTMRAMRKNPGSAPVILTKAEVLDAHHAAGQPAVDGRNPSAVPGEMGRVVRMQERTKHRLHG